MTIMTFLCTSVYVRPYQQIRKHRPATINIGLVPQLSLLDNPLIKVKHTEPMLTKSLPTISTLLQKFLVPDTVTPTHGFCVPLMLSFSSEIT